MGQSNIPSSPNSNMRPSDAGDPRASLQFDQAARRLAENTLTRHRVTRLPVEPWSIAAHEGANVYLGHFLTHGSLVYADHKYVITVNKTVNDHRQRFTIAHELGHLFLDRFRAESLSEDTDLLNQLEEVIRVPFDEEKFCDAFAGYLLVPEAAIVEFSGWSGISIDALARVASQLKVSIRTLVRRVLDSVPYNGAALYFRLSGKPTDPADVKLRLDAWYFAQQHGQYLPRHASIAENSPIHRALSTPTEKYYKGVAIELGNSTVHGSILVKRISKHGDILTLIVPIEADDEISSRRRFARPELPFMTRDSDPSAAES